MIIAVTFGKKRGNATPDAITPTMTLSPPPCEYEEEYYEEEEEGYWCCGCRAWLKEQPLECKEGQYCEECEYYDEETQYEEN